MPPYVTRGLPLTAADLPGSSRELLKSLASPDQRSSTDLNPRTALAGSPKAQGRARSPQRRSQTHPCEHLAWCHGGCPLPALGGQTHVAEILENSGKNHRWQHSVQSHVPPLGWLEAISDP